MEGRGPIHVPQVEAEQKEYPPGGTPLADSSEIVIGGDDTHVCDAPTARREASGIAGIWATRQPRGASISSANARHEAIRQQAFKRNAELEALRDKPVKRRARKDKLLGFRGRHASFDQSQGRTRTGRPSCVWRHD